MGLRVLQVLALAAPLYACGAASAANPEGLPPGFVHLRAIDSSIVQDMRYATARNFTGRPVPGYGAAECVLLRPVAEALARVQADLRPRGFSLKVYDCYRPARAVASFVRWTRAGGGFDPDYHPRVARNALVHQGYIASRSGHSLGNAVDLTLVALAPAESPTPAQGGAGGPCHGPRHQRQFDAGVDMGTGFDCFDRKANTWSGEITDDQRRSRRILLEAMQRQGFGNYSKEWWHFTYQPASKATQVHDFAIVPLPTPGP